MTIAAEARSLGPGPNSTSIEPGRQPIDFAAVIQADLATALQRATQHVNGQAGTLGNPDIARFGRLGALHLREPPDAEQAGIGRVEAFDVTDQVLARLDQLVPAATILERRAE